MLSPVGYIIIFMEKYGPGNIESKWQERWLKSGIFQPDLITARRPFYNLMMFPYPSAEGLHVGNMYAFTGADTYGRFMRMQGFDVFEPIGLDGFGIHSENYAIKAGKHPAKLGKRTQKNFYRQLHATGNAYAWENTLETYDPNYYKWTQWIFVQMYKNGLAYRAKAPVNWCPNCKTTLSDEQVVSGACERCKTVVEERKLEQWFFKITAYAEKLLKNLDWIDWSERVKIAQKNWIGKSEGILIKFKVANSKKQIEVFTTRSDTIYGVTFIVLSPNHPLISGKYSFPKKEATNTEKTGYFTGFYCLNPVRQLADEKIPVWVSDYVIGEYGTGAIMGVPAYDERDLEFAKKYKLPVKKVPLENLEEITQKIVKNGWGEKKIQYHLRDWCVSRQRYWGPPIPMIYCGKCALRHGSGQGWVPVREKDLPVLLPNIRQMADWRPKGEGTSPLAQCKEWLKVACPECGGAARRETDVSDTFLDSAWYFLRYPSTRSAVRLSSPSKSRSGQVPFDSEITKKWLPVDMYIGGAEHSVLHLMYSRFLTMVFKDLGLLEFEEPFKKFYAHGLLISKGAKMSKSRGNIVIPDEYIKAYGADTLRCYLMFLGPFDQGGDFRDTGIAGMWRFLNRVWRIVWEAEPSAFQPATRSILNQNQGHSTQSSPKGGVKVALEKGDAHLLRFMHQTIKEVTEDIKNLRYNTAIAKIMEYVNEIARSKKQIENSNLPREIIETLVLLLAPFAPHITEEIWCEVLGNKFSIHQQPWPKYDEKLVREETVTVVVEVNGKVSEKIDVRYQIADDRPEIEKLARESEKVKKHLAGKKIKKVIFVPGKLINFVI